MSITKSWNHTDTTVAGGEQPVLNLQPLNFNKDFALISQSNEKGARNAVITNLTTPMNIEENVRFMITNISNIYNNANVVESDQAQNCTGEKILVQLHAKQTVTDDVLGTTCVLPYSCQIVLTIPTHSAVDAEDVKSVLSRTVSTLFDTGAADCSARLTKLMKGQLVPDMD